MKHPDERCDVNAMREPTDARKVTFVTDEPRARPHYYVLLQGNSQSKSRFQRKTLAVGTNKFCSISSSFREIFVSSCNSKQRGGKVLKEQKGSNTAYTA